MSRELFVAIAAVAVILVVAAVISSRSAGKSGFSGPAQVDLTHGYPYGYALDTANPAEVAENRLYSSAEVDPIVAGQLYAGVRANGPNRRWIYGGRVSHADKWGLHEFSSGVPGETGVDVGPLGMGEYSLDGGKPDVFDDGIPENWRLPSTPVSWYVPAERDFYNVEASGPGVYAPHLTPLQEPDHDPLIN